jgi:hypothetical protein
VEQKMNLRELDQSLPNGFHDATIQAISVDYASSTAIVKLELLVGTPDADTPEERDSYKPAELHLSGVLYFLIDPPDPKRKYDQAKALWIDGGCYENGSAPSPPIPLTLLPNGVSTYWFFVHEWNSFIHLAAREANIRWASQ